MVSSLDLTCWTVHVGVMRRSVTKCGSFVLVAGVVIITEMSVGVGWKDILMGGVFWE